MLIWKQKYSLQAGGNCFVLCNSTGAIVSVFFNGWDIINSLIQYMWFDTLGSMIRFNVYLEMKNSLPTEGNLVVVCNSTGAIGRLVFNGVKRGGVDVDWIL